MSVLDKGAAAIRTSTARTPAKKPPATTGRVHARLSAARRGRLCSENRVWSGTVSSGRSMPAYTTVRVAELDLEDLMVLLPL